MKGVYRSSTTFMVQFSDHCCISYEFQIHLYILNIQQPFINEWWYIRYDFLNHNNWQVTQTIQKRPFKSEKLWPKQRYNNKV